MEKKKGKSQQKRLNSSGLKIVEALGGLIVYILSPGAPPG